MNLRFYIDPETNLPHIYDHYLKIIYVPEPKSYSAFVITAYELTGKPLSAYKRRQRSR